MLTIGTFIIIIITNYNNVLLCFLETFSCDEYCVYIFVMLPNEESKREKNWLRMQTTLINKRKKMKTQRSLFNNNRR